MEVLAAGALNFYPDVTASELREKLSSYVGLGVSYTQVFNGSDGALRAICETFLNADDLVLIREPTYAQIKPFIGSRGTRIVSFTGDTPFTSSPEKYREHLGNGEIVMVYIVNPNNPTGVMYDVSFIEELCSSYPRTLVLVDEAYFEFSGHTVAGLVQEYNNIVISRTFSKAFRLAGLRIGYILADPSLLSFINLTRNGKDVNVMAQLAAIAALEDLPYMRAYVDEVTTTRDWLFDELQKMAVEVYNTPANYLLIRVLNARRLVQSLKEKGVLVRDRSSLPQLDNTFRVSIGTRSQMMQFLEHFATLL